MPSSLALSAADSSPAVDVVATAVEALAFQAVFSASVTNLFEASWKIIAGGCVAG
ncbi:hypothetical protein D3C72_2472860 [compost metagenome]